MFGVNGDAEDVAFGCICEQYELSAEFIQNLLNNKKEWIKIK